MSEEHKDVKYQVGQVTIISYLAKEKFNRNYQMAAEYFCAVLHDRFKQDFLEFPDKHQEVVKKYKDLIDGMNGEHDTDLEGMVE